MKDRIVVDTRGTPSLPPCARRDCSKRTQQTQGGEAPFRTQIFWGKFRPDSAGAGGETNPEDAMEDLAVVVAAAEESRSLRYAAG